MILNNVNDIDTCLKIGRSIWMNVEEWEKVAYETVTAVSLLELPPERVVDQAVRLLVDRARPNEVTDHPFYRLPVQQRLILAALRWSDWSYARIGKLLDQKPEQVEELAWKARVQLNLPGIFPSGPISMGANCPEYLPRRPWAQRLLDEAIESGKDRVFLQGHLMVCASCQALLHRTRQIYFKAEKLVPEGEETRILAESLTEVLAQNPKRQRSISDELTRSLHFFWKSPDIRLLLLLGVGLLIWCVAKI